MLFSTPTLHPGVIAAPEEQELVRGQFEALVARRPKLAEQRLEMGRRIPIPLTTVTQKGGFDSYIVVQFPNPGGEPTMAGLLVDSGNTVMVVPHASPLLNTNLYADLGATIEPWGCPAYVLKGPLQIPTADGGLYEIAECVFYACYQDNPNGGGRTANFGTGRVTPILAADFSAFLHQLKGLRNASVTLERDALALAVAQPGPDLTARVRLVPASDRPFAIAFERVRVGGVPLPGLLVDWVVRGYDPSLGLASRLPVRLEVGRVEITTEAIRVAAGP